MAGGDDCPGVGEAAARCLGERAPSDTINLEVDPPDAWYAEETPLIGFAEEAAGWEPLDDAEPDEPGDGEEWDANAEEEDVPRK